MKGFTAIRRRVLIINLIFEGSYIKYFIISEERSCLAIKIKIDERMPFAEPFILLYLHIVMRIMFLAGMVAVFHFFRSA